MCNMVHSICNSLQNRNIYLAIYFINFAAESLNSFQQIPKSALQKNVSQPVKMSFDGFI